MVNQPNGVMIGQDRLEKILSQHLEHRYKTRVEFGTALKTFEQNEDEVIACIVKSQGGNITEEILNVGWLIGTDGAKGM